MRLLDIVPAMPASARLARAADCGAIRIRFLQDMPLGVAADPQAAGEGIGQVVHAPDEMHQAEAAHRPAEERVQEGMSQRRRREQQHGAVPSRAPGSEEEEEARLHTVDDEKSAE